MSNPDLFTFGAVALKPESAPLADRTPVAATIPPHWPAEHRALLDRYARCPNPELWAYGRLLDLYRGALPALAEPDLCPVCRVPSAARYKPWTWLHSVDCAAAYGTRQREKAVAALAMLGIHAPEGWEP